MSVVTNATGVTGHAGGRFCRLLPRAITIDVDLRAGGQQATIWTNDLSIAYVHEHSAFPT